MPQLDEPFDDHASLAASLEDFEAQERRSPLFDIPSQVSNIWKVEIGACRDGEMHAGGLALKS